jgi:precorrin-3B synthase
VDDASPWTGVTACVGAPGCTKSQIDTRFLATELVGLLGHRSPRLHVVGCERRCGAPATDHLDLVAPASVAAALLQIERRERVR